MVWERIRQKQHQQAEERRQQEAAQREQARLRREAAAQAEREAAALRLKLQQEEQERKNKRWSLVYHSQIIPRLEELQSGMNVSNSNIIASEDYSSITLAWGRYSLVAESMQYKEHRFKQGRIAFDRKIVDYSYIEADIDIDTNSIKINGRKIPRDKWKTEIVDALADAYMTPLHNMKREDEPIQRNDNHGSSYTECCCQ